MLTGALRMATGWLWRSLPRRIQGCCCWCASAALPALKPRRLRGGCSRALRNPMRRPDKAEALMGRARSTLRTVFWIATACICGALTNPATAQSMQPLGQQSPVRIGVFSLFRPKELVLRPVAGSSLAVVLGGNHLTLPRDAPFLSVHEIDGVVQFQLEPESQPARGA